MNRLKRLYRKVFRAFSHMPHLLRFGIVIFIISGTLDLLYHGISTFSPGSLDAYLGPDGYYIHLTLFFSMLFIILGVIRTKPNPGAAQEDFSPPSSSNPAARSFIRR